MTIHLAMTLVLAYISALQRTIVDLTPPNNKRSYSIIPGGSISSARPMHYSLPLTLRVTGCEIANGMAQVALTVTNHGQESFSFPRSQDRDRMLQDYPNKRKLSSLSFSLDNTHAADRSQSAVSLASTDMLKMSFVNIMPGQSQQFRLATAQPSGKLRDASHLYLLYDEERPQDGKPLTVVQWAESLQSANSFTCATGQSKP